MRVNIEDSPAWIHPMNISAVVALDEKTQVYTNGDSSPFVIDHDFEQVTAYLNELFQAPALEPKEENND
jgi:hypothetical protein